MSFASPPISALNGIFYRTTPADASRLMGPWCARCPVIIKTKIKPATPPDEHAVWIVNGRTIRVEIWPALVLPKTVPNDNNLTFDVYAFYDPAFKQPWLLATSVNLTFVSVHAIYTDRWPVEQIPLSGSVLIANSSIIPNVF